MEDKINSSYKIIADHLRSSTFLIADGILPANEGRGYVLRRIIRRALLHCHKINPKQAFFYKLTSSLIKQMGQAYPEIIQAQETIISTLEDEEERFHKTLDKGINLLEEELKNIKNNLFSGHTAFKLYDTYGFPLDLTQTILAEKNIEVDITEFEKSMAEQKHRARQNWSGSGEKQEESLLFELNNKYQATKFTGYEQTKSPAKILGIIIDGKEAKSINENDTNKEISIILDQTPFYATSGGQKGDDGCLILASDFDKNSQIKYSEVKNIIDIVETKKTSNSLFLHFVKKDTKAIKGKFSVGDDIMALVNNRNRQFYCQNHSATHLLHYALKEILGNHITQKGSNVESEYLTFDFNHNKALSDIEIRQIEDLVNFFIRQNSEVKTEILPIKEAQSQGATALFGEKYDDIVRVLSIGKKDENQNASIELCGGTHVTSTGNIGLFKIISEKGIAAGIRRIEAKTGYFALQYLNLQEQRLKSLLESLKIKENTAEITKPQNFFFSNKTGFDDISFFDEENKKHKITSDTESSEILEIISKTFELGSNKIKQIKEKDKEIAKLKQDSLTSNSNQFNIENIGQINLIHHIFEDVNAKDLRDLIIQIRSKKEYKAQHVILFFAKFEGKIPVCLSLSQDLCQKFNAGKLIAKIVDKIGGKGGGGKPELAFGGGNDATKINEAIAILKKELI